MKMAWACCIGLLSAASTAFAAEEPKPPEGSFLIGGKTYQVKHALAYEVLESDAKLVSLIVSDRRIPTAEVKAALKENDGSDRSLLLSQPYVRVVFNRDGTAQYVNGAANGTNFGSSGELGGQVKIADGRIAGTVKLEKTGEEPFVRAFDLKIDTPIGLDMPAKPVAKPTTPVKPTVTGTFKGNDKNAKLAFVSARRGEPFADKPSIVLVFTEKDHSKDPKPDFNAGFGRYGSALIISTHEDGSIFGCEVAHQSLKGTFSSSGRIHTDEFDAGDGQVSGRITTDGVADTFNQTWEVDIKFAVPFVPPAEKPVAEPKTASTKAPSKSVEKKPAGKSPAKMPAGKSDDGPAAAGKVAVGDLPFLKGVAVVNYNEIVGMLDFKSTTGVTALAAEMQKSLATQGWTGDGADLVNPNSTILSRKRGEAELTIFIKPSGKGSEVKVMSEGLDWSKK